MTTTRSKRTSTEAVMTIWRRYKATGDPKLRDRLVLTYAPMVKYIVDRKVRELPAHKEAADLISCGLEALIRSIDRWDPEGGATLEHYAWTRIQGAILDELRRDDWAPRSLRRWEREISRARERFTALNGRAPSNPELAAAMSIGERELNKRLSDVSRSELAALNAVVTNDEETTIERIDTLPSNDLDSDPEHCALTTSARERFREAFEQLSQRERQVAVLLYTHNLTLREIGEVLRVTESRVSQIHSQMRRRLREALAAEEELFAQYA